MSSAAPAPLGDPSPRPVLRIRAKRLRRLIIFTLLLAAAAAAATYYGLRAYRDLTGTKADIIPTAKVIRGDVTLDISARGELRGGNPELLIAPTTGGTDMHLTFLKTTGEPVKEGEMVAQFDTTEQEYKLKEAEADLAEAEAKLAQAKAQNEAQDEEDRYALAKAENDVRLAELEARRNPLLPTLTAKENTLALDAAKDHLVQLQHNQANRKATNEAAIAIQEAARGKSESQAKTARDNIAAMTLKAKRDGYVAVRQNASGNMMFWGMVLPLFQVGDLVRPGMAVAEIPDMKDWEISANIGELDRGHIAVGEKVKIEIIALPDHPFAGHVKEVGGTSGSAWDRHFECRIALDNPAAELRPGMSARIVVTTDEMKGVLSLPAQALFESDGKSFVYVQTPSGFTPRDVTLVRRNEMRVVVTGVAEGQLVAMANPTETAAKKKASGPSIPK